MVFKADGFDTSEGTFTLFSEFLFSCLKLRRLPSLSHACTNLNNLSIVWCSCHSIAMIQTSVASIDYIPSVQSVDGLYTSLYSLRLTNIPCFYSMTLFGFFSFSCRLKCQFPLPPAPPPLPPIDGIVTKAVFSTPNGEM